MFYAPLNRDELCSIIEGRSAVSRVPVAIHLWVHPENFGDRKDAVLEILSRYPMDVQTLPVNMPKIYESRELDPNYRWVNWDDPNIDKVVAIDQQIAIPDWGLLDEVLENFPKPTYPVLFKEEHVEDCRYKLALWWFTLFERHWSLRGMSNALMDYYTDPKCVHRLFRALTDFYIAMIVRVNKEADADGIMISDDLGTQNGPFFSLDIFRVFFKPYYREIFDTIHSLGMHVWMHACGNIEQFIPELIEIGLDVLHPVQKHAMDMSRIAQVYADKLCFWAGLDVQQIIPWGTPDDVRAEVRYLINTFQRPGGRLIMTAGNGINGDCSLENLEAFFDECFKYGSSIVPRA